MKCVFLTVAYNAEKTIARAMNSVLNQTYKDWIYYVVDNGSTDATNDIIQRYARKNPKIRPCHKDVNDVRTYIEYIRKIVEDETEAEWLCTLDADDEYEFDFLKNAVGVLHDPEIDMVILGTKMYDANTLVCKSSNVLPSSLLIDESNLDNVFPQIHWYLRQLWGKLWKISVMKTYYITYDDRVGYGADTLLVYQFFIHAKKLYILNKVGYKYYISSASISYTFDEKRIFSDQYLIKYQSEVLQKKCGRISDENWGFLYAVYYYALRDTLKVLNNAHVNSNDKVCALYNMVCNDYSRQLIKRVGKENRLFDDIVSELCRTDIFENCTTINLAAEIFFVLERYPKAIDGVSNEQLFELLGCIQKYISGKNDIFYRTVEKVAWVSSLLYGISAEKLMQIRTIVEKILCNHFEDALNDIVLKFQMSQDVPENLIDTVIELGLNLSAELQRDEEYIFLKKIYIQALIQLGKKDRALEELDDWDIIFPGDEDFINFRKYLEGNI